MNRHLLAGGLSEADRALAKLSEEERRSLRKLRPHTLKESISSEHEEKLVRLGLVERKLGGLTLTFVGKLAADKVSG
jgi:hypothetical protein